MQVIRHIASRDRHRYQRHDYDLDLTYVLPNLIAMSFPGDKYEKIYSNDIEDVARFLDEQHGDHYHVYNLCEERSYNTKYFHNRVSRYPIDDYNPPPITMMRLFCDDVDRWLSADPRNVAAIHCHAGKGRTGTMICAYLLYKRMFATAERAIQFFHSKRVLPSRKAMHPGQRRYVRYFARLVRERFLYTPRRLQLMAVEFNICPAINSILCSVCFTVTQLSDSGRRKFKSPVFHASSGDVQQLVMRLPRPPIVSGDFRVMFYDKRGPSKTLVFWICLNTYFVGSSSAPTDAGQWTGVTQRPGACHDGSRPGPRCLVSVHTVGNPSDVTTPARPITVLLPQPELDIVKQYRLNDVIDPQFTVKLQFAAVRDDF